jgi:PAS domain S-box-containing protein
MDWSTSPLGNPADWPQSLRTLVNLLLNSKFPMFIAWGQELGFLYNDPYSEILGAKHPAAMGRRFKDVWSEIWDDVAPLVTKALSGEATFHEDLPLMMQRKGFQEQTYFTFSYSPVHDEAGTIGGVFCACTETTREVEARAAYQADQEYLHDLFKQAPGFVAILRGPDHVFELVNASYLQLVGHRDIVGKPVRQVLPELEGQGFFELVDGVYQSGEPFVGRNLAVKLQRQPGSSVEERFLDLVYQPIFDRTGRVTGIFAEGYDVTERVHAEVALRASEERLRRSQELGGALPYEWDITTNQLLAHPAFSKLYGLNDDEPLTYEAVTARIHPEDLSRVRAIHQNAFKMGGPYEQEYRIVLSDGAIRWVMARGEPVYGESGEPTALAGVVIDISQRKLAELALAESEERFRLLADGAPALIWMSDETGQITFANRHYETMFGNPAAAVEGEGWKNIVHPDDVESFSAAFLKGFEQREPVSISVRVKDRNGATRWLRCEGVPRFDSSGSFLGFIGCNVDISEAKVSEIALRESEERHRILFEQAAAGVGHMDLDGHWLMVNQTLHDILGYAEGELIGRTLQSLTHPDHLDDDQPLLLALDAGEIPSFRCERQYIRKDGSVVWVETTVSLVRNHSGTPIYRVAIIQDIQNRKIGEEALRASESRLRLALDAGRMAVWESDSGTGSITTSPELNRLLGFPSGTSPTPEQIRSRYAPGARERLQAAASAALRRGERHAEEELEVIWPDGSRHWLLLRADLETTSGPDGIRIKATGIAFDITARKRWAEHQRILIDELNHRVKNTLATVQSLAAHTFRNLNEASRPALIAFEERLFALSRAHDVLTRENWDGAELGEVITEVLEPYLRHSGRRFAIEGSPLRLAPGVALALAMAIHELATNAAKYGALSVPSGRTSISWTTTGDDPALLVLRWEEHGGPPVAPPSRKGFGTRLIERMLATDLSGQVQLTFAPTGVVCVVKAPLKQQEHPPASEPTIRLVV